MIHDSIIKIFLVIGVLVVLSVTAIVMWIPMSTDEIIGQEIHPCQQNELDMTNFYINLEYGIKHSQEESALINYEYREFIKKSDECFKYYHEWMTPEFQEKMKPLYKRLEEKRQ